VSDQSKKQRSEGEDVKSTTKFARPNNLDEVPIDSPPPLPPSPGDVAVEGWFDSQPTFTAPRVGKRVDDEDEDTGTGTDAGTGATVERPLPPSETTASTAAVPARPPIALVALAALVVGILIGAFGLGQLVAGRSAPDCECAEE